MRKIIFIILLLSAGVNSFCQLPLKNLLTEDLKGKVLFAEQETYTVSTASFTDTTRKEYIAFKEYLYFDRKGLLTSNVNWFYADMGMDTSREKPSKIDYKHDEGGRATEMVSYFPNGERWTNINYKYVSTDTLQLESYFSPKNEFTGKSVFIFNKKNNLSEADYYQAQGPLYMKTFYQYDNPGRMTSEYTNANDGSFMYTINYEYDNSGRRIKETKHYPKTDLTEVTSFSYSAFDKTGNWTKLGKFFNGHLQTTVYRKITYYR